MRLAFRRSFHYASPAYHSALLPAVAADPGKIRSAALAALEDSKAIKASWHTKPVTSLLNGKSLENGERVDTMDAFGNANGAQLLASASEMAQLIEHAASFHPERTDLREPVRAAEAALLSPAHFGALVANQTLDFGKQDGVTEIEEALQANPVERRLNDQLWTAEEQGVVSIPRRTIFVPCVSNFSHFLDLCRKTLRTIELGVPVVVLSRSHTSQYPYRWVLALSEELSRSGVDPRYLTFCSSGLAQQQELIRAVTRATATVMGPNAAPTPFLFTGARSLAKKIKAEVCDGMIASTQGPNLMVAMGLPKSVAAAAAMSATIENSGQCTALRVLVAPEADATSEVVEGMFAATSTGGDAAEYLAAGQFAGLLDPPPTDVAGGAAVVPSGYTAHPTLGSGVSYRLRAGLPAMPATLGGGPEDFDEHWRQVVVDVVTPPQDGSAGSAASSSSSSSAETHSTCAIYSDQFLDGIGAWLVKHQPITLSINGLTGDREASDHDAPAPEHYAVARRLFERSALCVYSVGDADRPALTAQARPQDGETFGELPPLGELTDVTRFPMVVPSAQAAYFSHYRREYLASAADGAAEAASPIWGGYANGQRGTLGVFVDAASDPAVKGYLLELGEYLRAAAVGPQRTHATRTCLYGWQRPPLDGRLTAIRCGELTTLDELLPYLLPFCLTNAAPQCLLTVDPSNDTLLDELPRLQLRAKGLEDVDFRLHTEADMRSDAMQAMLHRTLRPAELGSTHPFPLAQQFVSRLLPLGHVKSARPDDSHFLKVFEPSEKWLRFDEAVA